MLTIVRNFLSANRNMVTSVVIVIILLTLAYCSGRSGGKSSAIISQQKREIKVQQDINEANSNAADARLEDSTELQSQQKEIEDAVRNATGSDDIRARRGCVILRQQGRDTLSLPACSRS